jgi:hypothetical protein
VLASHWRLAHQNVRVFTGHATLEDQLTTMSRNAGQQVPSDTVTYPTSTKTSTEPLRKPKILYSTQKCHDIKWTFI